VGAALEASVVVFSAGAWARVAMERLQNANVIARLAIAEARGWGVAVIDCWLDGPGGYRALAMF
jgi:hypothetical protein